MKTSLLILFVILAPLVRAPAAQEQPAAAAGGAQRFSKDGLSFDYPAGWTLGGGGDGEMQSLTLRRAGVSTIIMVFAQREPLQTAAQLSAARKAVTLPYVESLAHRLGLIKLPDDSECVKVGERNAVGFRLAGQVEKRPTTAEVYTIVLGGRLLHLVHIRADREDAQGAPAWKTLLDTLKVEEPAAPSPEVENFIHVLTGGVLKGKALKKPRPDYPPVAKQAQVEGEVGVEILVDERGDVISARAVSGHQLLLESSVEAARRAKFSPTTVCGEPVKVTGVIKYNYVLQR